MIDYAELENKINRVLDKATPRRLRKWVNNYNNKPYHKQTNFINRLKRRK